MSRLKYLKQFDKTQLWRLFVDGRFHKKYDGWVGYEAGERGSIQALLNGFSFMLDNFDISNGLRCTYLRELHKVCMLSVETTNLKSSPGDIRFLNSGIPFFSKSTTYEHLVEVFEMRKGDGTTIFNTNKYAKTADELDVTKIYKALLKDGRINYRNWYPNLTTQETQAIEGKRTLHEFYKVKHFVQMQMISKMEDIVERYNNNIKYASNDDEKLRIISLVSRELELLHPFPDGNSRTFSCITLNHLLMYNGFAPVLLENPNLDNEVSHAQWIEEVKKGMQRTNELIANPHAMIFNYSILDMNKINIKKFIDMAKPTIKKIEEYKEIYLTPEILERLSEGTWFNVNYNMRFSGVGEYNTYKNGHLYFMLSLNEWNKKSENIDNNIQKLIEKGIRAFVTDDEKLAKESIYPTLLVKNVRESYNTIATQTREEVNPKTILVTGTEGKTGMKVQLHHLLSFQTNVHANINSANTEIPVLRSLINLDADTNVEINEVSVGGNEALRVQRTKWVNPDICIFTNIGPNHMDMHKNIDNIIEAKSSVVEGLRDDGICIINSDMEQFNPLLKAINRRKKNIKYFTFGSSDQDDAQLLKTRFENNKLGWSIEARIEDEVIKYFIPMIQEHITLSSVGTLLAIKKLGLDVKKAARDFEGLKPYETMGRLLTIHKNEGDVLFYDQSRRGGIHGMKSAFNGLNKFKIKGKIVALIGGISIKKDSAWTKESHTELAKLINNSKIDKLYTTGNFMNYVEDNLINKSIFAEHSDDLDYLATILMNDVKPDDLLFIIGSAYLYLGRVTDKIFKKYKYEHFDYKKPLRNFAKEKLESSKFYKTFKESKKDLPLEDFKADILMKFFHDSDKYIVEKFGFKNVTDKFPSKAYTQEFCKAWFYNDTKDKKEKGKSVFGSYYYFNSPEYLFHIDFATHNIHIGLVKYSHNAEEYKLERFNDNEYSRAIKMYSKYLPSNITLVPRSWGGNWCSIDCGKFIDLLDDEKFSALYNLKQSAFLSKILNPMLKCL